MSVLSFRTLPTRGRRPNADAGALFVALDSALSEPLYEQLYKGIRDAVLAGRLGPTMRIPSTRSLAADLSISRTTVLMAIAQLVAEGFLTSHPRSGTAVASTLPDQLLTARRATPVRKAQALTRRAIGAGARRASGAHDGIARLGAAPRPFRPGTPALDRFPTDLWSRLALRRYRRLAFAVLETGDPAGYAPLRAAIAAHVQIARGVQCTPEQVIVTSGAQQALALVAQVLLTPGDDVWMEDPGYLSMRGVLEMANVNIVAVPVDDEGLDVGFGIRKCADAQLAYVTPSHQFPLGITMTRRRRVELVRWAQEAGAWIIEDDYDSESRFEGQPLPALHALDTAGRVLYVGTFSKTVFPALRIGYVIAPPDLVAPLTNARVLAGGHPSTIDQSILADFIVQGHFARHVRRMRALHAERQHRLVAAAVEQLSGLVSVRRSRAGLHLVAWLPDGVSDQDISESLALRGIEAPALSRYYAEDGAPRGGLLLGYGALDDIALGEGVRAIRDVVSAAIHDRSMTQLPVKSAPTPVIRPAALAATRCAEPRRKPSLLASAQTHI